MACFWFHSRILAICPGSRPGPQLQPGDAACCFATLQGPACAGRAAADKPLYAVRPRITTSCSLTNLYSYSSLLEPRSSPPPPSNSEMVQPAVALAVLDPVFCAQVPVSAAYSRAMDRDANCYGVGRQGTEQPPPALAQLPRRHTLPTHPCPRSPLSRWCLKPRRTWPA